MAYVQHSDKQRKEETKSTGRERSTSSIVYWPEMINFECLKF